MDTLKASKIVEPKDLKVKIGSPAEALWTQVRDETKSQIENSKRNMIVQQGMLELAESKIRIEKSKS